MVTYLSEKLLKFKWASECKEAFHLLKTALACAPILVFPTYQGTLTLDTNAIGHAVGFILLQAYRAGRDQVVKCGSIT